MVKEMFEELVSLIEKVATVRIREMDGSYCIEEYQSLDTAIKDFHDKWVFKDPYQPEK